MLPTVRYSLSLCATHSIGANAHSLRLGPFVNSAEARFDPKQHVVPFRSDVVDVIAKAVDAVPSLAPYQLPGGAVYQFTVGEHADRPVAMVTLWPTLRRVDAIGPGVAVVFTCVATVQLVPGVEVLFRRDGGEYLIVARSGKIIVRS